MAKAVWDETGKRFYETGIRKGMLYLLKDGEYKNGVVWDGLSSVTETPSGADESAIYADDIKYLSLRAKEEFGGTIEAYQFPDEFYECDGSASPLAGVVIGQQTRATFGLCYRTAIGNDELHDDYGYKLHLVYGATVNPSDRQYSTINDSPEAMTMSWEFATIPVAVDGYKETSIVTINSKKVNATKLKALEDILYGTESTEPRLPLPAEVFSTLSTTTGQ